MPVLPVMVTLPETVKTLSLPTYTPPPPYLAVLPEMLPPYMRKGLLAKTYTPPPAPLVAVLPVISPPYILNAVPLPPLLAPLSRSTPLLCWLTFPEMLPPYMLKVPMAYTPRPIYFVPPACSAWVILPYSALPPLQSQRVKV